jgi:hypothetical protein
VAEQLSLISDALYLEATHLEAAHPQAPEERPEPGVTTSEQALAVARWIHADAAAAFPGRGWLRQPLSCSDRDWILEIARQYRSLAADSQSPS